MKRAAILTGAAVVLGVVAQSWGSLLPVNSNTVVQDGIEYYIETDKVVYDLGGDVEILFRITNLTDEVWSRVSPFSIMNLVIERTGVGEPELVWSGPYAGSTRPARIMLDPGESHDLAKTWPQWDNHYNPVFAGTYRITGAVHYVADTERVDYFPVNVDFAIIPEPCSGVLFVAGTVLTFFNWKGRKKI